MTRTPSLDPRMHAFLAQHGYEACTLAVDPDEPALAGVAFYGFPDMRTLATRLLAPARLPAAFAAFEHGCHIRIGKDMGFHPRDHERSMEVLGQWGPLPRMSAEEVHAFADLVRAVREDVVALSRALCRQAPQAAAA